MNTMGRERDYFQPSRGIYIQVCHLFLPWVVLGLEEMHVLCHYDQAVQCKCVKTLLESLVHMPVPHWRRIKLIHYKPI